MNELKNGVTFSCQQDQCISVPFSNTTLIPAANGCDAGSICPVTSGDQVIKILNLADNSIGFDALMMAVWVVGTRILAYLSLRLFVKDQI